MRLAILGKKLAAVLPALVMTLSLGLTGLVATTGTALADCTVNGSSDLTVSNGVNCAKGTSAADSLFGNGGVFTIIANTLIFLVGAIAVLFLIIGGLRYVISQGDPKNVEGAKNTILYAIVGIVVAILSYAAVQFVLNALGKGNS